MTGLGIITILRMVITMVTPIWVTTTLAIIHLASMEVTLDMAITQVSMATMDMVDIIQDILEVTHVIRNTHTMDIMEVRDIGDRHRSFWGPLSCGH